MKNIRTFIDEETGIEHIMIYESETEFISMPKSVYDAQQAAQEAQSL